MTERVDAFAVTLDTSIPVRAGEWDGARGEREIFEFATDDDGVVDWRKAARGFVFADLNPPEGDEINRGSFKMPLCYVEDGELVAIGNAINNALARLSQVEDISETARADGLAALKTMQAKLQAESSADTLPGAEIVADVERSEEERATIREEFPRLINGTPSQMREWSGSPYAGENRKEGDARESARDALRRVIALKEKPMSEWTEGDYDDAVKAIAFVKRMSEVEQGDPIVIEGREGPSERDASLRDWGHWTDAASTVADDGRVYRTCTMDFVIDATTRTMVDRALAIAEQLGPRTDAAQVRSICEQLRTDGFADRIGADGSVVVTGLAARTGSQLYGDGKSTWYEYRPDAEVEKSLAGYAHKTFTDDHPPVLVTADNWRLYARGHLGNDAVLLPVADDGHRYVQVSICVCDVATLRRMQAGKVELSAGYTTIALRKPGVDAHGIAYKFVQTDIEINHLALVDQGRAGPRARVQIDGATVFEIKDNTDMANPVNDQLSPEQVAAVLAAFKSLHMASDPAAAEAAMQALATALGTDIEMVRSALPMSYPEAEMVEMEMDGVTFSVSKDAAAALRERVQRVTNDAAKMQTDLATAQGKISVLERTTAELKAANDAAELRELERLIAPMCPHLVKSWADGKTRPATCTAMRAAAIVDLDPAAQVDLDSAMGPDKSKPAPTFDAYVLSVFNTTMRLAASRRAANDNTGAAPKRGINIDTRNLYGHRGQETQQ